MSIGLDEFNFNDTAYGIVALKKIGDVSDNFYLYSAESVSGGIRVMGAEFREAKTGKNKGKKTIMIKETIKDMFVSNSEL